MTRDDIIAHVRDTYDAEPERLWPKYPNDFVLRRRDNRKWFAVVMDVARARLDLPGEGDVCIMNVKCGPILLGSYLGQPGILPAYHMNKNNWLSIVLNTAAQQDIEELLALSYDLVG